MKGENIVNRDPMHRHDDSGLLVLPDLGSKQKYVQWIVIAATWILLIILIFGHGSRLANDITEAYEVIGGALGIGCFLSIALCLAEWIVRSILHWQSNDHTAGTAWLPREIESRLYFLPMLRFCFSWFSLLLIGGFVVVLSAFVVYLISFGHFGFVGNFGSGAEHM
jgi:hypothetical protein